MPLYIIDTNVAIIANGRSKGQKIPSSSCRLATVKLLQEALSKGVILIDIAGQIQAEYRRHLNPNGQPGVGDRFYQAVINSSPNIIRRVDLVLKPNGEFKDLPETLAASGFDPSDRKFAALAHRCNAPVYNATDSDWVEHAELLRAENIEVRHLCGSDKAGWFTP